MTLRIGSLFSGVLGLDLAVESVLGGELAWACENDDAARKVIAHHRPDVPILGDITAVEWDQVEPIDILTGGFPCFPAGTLIATSTGLASIEEVKEGDLVLTHRRRWKPVTQTMGRRADHRISIKAMGTPTISTTDGHPFYVRQTRDGSPEWINASELQPGMYLAQPLDDEAIEVPSEGDLAVAYLIGRWLGDGWTVTHKRSSKIPQGQRGSRVSSVARRVHWCCAPKETAHLESAFKAAGISPSRVDDRAVVKYVMQSAKWADVLDRYGKYAHGKRIPEATHRMPRVVQAEILRGWTDADGSTKADGAIGITTVSRALALGMARIARHVYGKAVSLHEAPARQQSRIEGRLVNNRASWEVRISPGPSKRGYIDDGFAWVPVRSVTRTQEHQDVFNISVLDDESYVAESVVVHNCTDVSVAGQRAGMHSGTRSGLWAHMAHAIAQLRPQVVVIENVRGLLTSRGAEPTAELVAAWAERDKAARVLRLIDSKLRRARREGKRDHVHYHAQDRKRFMGRHRAAVAAAKRADALIVRAIGAVLGTLADLGFDAVWCGLPASAVGAPHGRFRIFILAVDARPDRSQWGGWDRKLPSVARGVAPNPAGNGREQGWSESARIIGGPDVALGRGETAANSAGPRRPQHLTCAAVGRGGSATSVAGQVQSGGLGSATADTIGSGLEVGSVEHHGPQRSAAERGSDTSVAHAHAHGVGSIRAGRERRGWPGSANGDDPAANTDGGGCQGDEIDEQQGRVAAERDCASGIDWGVYAPAIRRWERIIGRPAPVPRVTGPRGGLKLNPALPEWMMGFPQGWITDVPAVSMNDALKLAGNSVCPRQAEAALRWLLAQLEDA